MARVVAPLQSAADRVASMPGIMRSRRIRSGWPAAACASHPLHRPPPRREVGDLQEVPHHLPEQASSSTTRMRAMGMALFVLRAG